MTVVLDKADLVPFANGVGFADGGIAGHIVEATGEVILFLIVVGADIVQHLHFGTGDIGGGILRVFLHIKNNSTVAAFGDNPFQAEFVVLIPIIGHEVSAAVGGLGGIVHEGAVANVPSRSNRIAQVGMPAVCR